MKFKKKYAIIGAVIPILLILTFAGLHFFLLYSQSPVPIQLQEDPPATGNVTDSTPLNNAVRDLEAGQSLSQADESPDVSTLTDIPSFSGSPYVEINSSIPFISPDDTTSGAFETYSDLDPFGRCGPAFAIVGKETMPTDERGQIGMIKPSGWHTVRYDDLIEDHYLYNRCHLIGYQLTGENANPLNLITGTRYFNVVGMQPFEDLVASYVIKSGNHVLYRVTPVYQDDNLVANGVLIEALSVEDDGNGIKFCVFVFNVQPGIVIDYATGDSAREVKDADIESVEFYGYIGNRHSNVFHLPTCPNLPAEKNQILFETRDDAIAAGFRACGNCHP